MAIEFLSEDLSLGGVQRKPVPALPFLRCLQLKIINYQSSVFWVACPELLQSYFGVAYSATLQRQGETLTKICSVSKYVHPMLSDRHCRSHGDHNRRGPCPHAGKVYN